MDPVRLAKRKRYEREHKVITNVVAAALLSIHLASRCAFEVMVLLGRFWMILVEMFYVQATCVIICFRLQKKRKLP